MNSDLPHHRFLQPDLVSHNAPQLVDSLLGDAFRHGDRRDASRLSADDVTQPAATRGATDEAV